MIRNAFPGLRFYCLNHDEPIPFIEYVDAAQPFYACVKYMKRDAQHPDGYGEDEKPCHNRLSFYAAATIMERLQKELSDQLDAGAFADLTNTRFTVKGYDVRVLLHTDDELRVGVKNRSEVRRWT